MTRVYTTGEKPSNPVILEDVVREITDIREEPTPEDTTDVKSWSYEIEAVYPKDAYIKRIKTLLDAETNANLDNSEVIAEILAAVTGGE